MANLAYELLNEGILTDEPDIYYNIRELRNKILYFTLSWISLCPGF